MSVSEVAQKQAEDAETMTRAQDKLEDWGRFDLSICNIFGILMLISELLVETRVETRVDFTLDLSPTKEWDKGAQDQELPMQSVLSKIFIRKISIA
ncbi:hypothetical protein ACJRO7_030167 [Eucalyptus globulus]|uniref:Uncharacterized protein n=1 Tax=Eucalyptus globulus TaxID=34317 RepID=A0ABD3JGJ4_EUCGL